MFAIQKDGISALSLQRSLEIGSYQTAWAMLHRVRSVLVRPGRERLQGTVEVDETYIGGDEPGLSGGRAKGKKALVGVAVERIAPRGFGRCRMALLADASANSLRAFLLDNVQSRAIVVTDGWQPYRPATHELYVHDRRAGAAGTQASKLLPGVHKVSSLAKRGDLVGTHQEAIKQTHLASYLNEFVFRFNRRRSRSRGLVWLSHPGSDGDF
jgi:ISXO2-like transposase domain